MVKRRILMAYFHHASHEFSEGTQKRIRVKLKVFSEEMVPPVDGVQDCLQSDLYKNIIIILLLLL